MPRLLIVNPSASGVTPAVTAAVRSALGDDVELALTEGRGHATEITWSVAHQVDVLYVFSGDGTYNEVLNGLGDRSGSETPVGFLPGGGTSVLPRALGLPRDPVAAARRLAAGMPRRITLGRANGRRFAFSAGIGFDAEIVRRVDRLGRRPDGRRPGDLAFVRAGAGLLRERGFRLEPRLEIAGLGRAAFALFANCCPYTYAGPLGIRAAPGARFDGGLDLFAPVRVRRLGLPFALAGVFRGHVRGAIVAHDEERFVVRPDSPTPMQLDGEDLGDVDFVVIEAEREAVTVLV